MQMVNFDCSKKDRALIEKIASRYNDNREKDGFDRIDEIDLQMDILACHANGCPLRLKDMLKADDFHLSHDVIGISKHLCRETGKLMNHFLPKFRQKEQIT